MDLQQIQTSILGSMSEQVYVRDLDKNIIYINRASEELTGWTRAEAENRKCYEVFGDEEQDCRLVCPVDKAIKAQRNLQHHEGKLKTRGGDVLDMRVSITLLKEEVGISGAAVVMQDITAMKTMEQTSLKTLIKLEKEIELRKRIDGILRRRADFEHLITQISTKLVSLDVQNIDEGIDYALSEVAVFSDVDRAYVFVFKNNGKRMDNTHEWCAEGITPEREHLQDITLEEELPWFSKHIRENRIFHVPDVSALPQHANMEKSHFQEQGIQSLIVVPMAIETRLIGFLGFDSVRSTRMWNWDDQMLLRLVGENIAHLLERKRMEEENEQLQVQLIQSQKMEAIGHLAGGVAHDFNNMLGIMMGAAQLAMMDLDPDSDVFHEQKLILDTAKRAKDLTGKLLTFARREDPNVKSQSINEIVMDICDVLKRSLPKIIKIETELEAGLKNVDVDQNQIRQALLNIFNNAVDAMPDGGAIAIKTFTVKRGDENCGQKSETNRECCLVQIADTGTGINENIVENIYDPFFTTKSVGKGTGLGLSVTHGIISAHKGTISVNSEPGQGSVFSIFLPFSSSDAPAVKSSGESDGIRGDEVVLLVDDELDILKVYQKLLQKRGYQVLGADCGKSALEIFDEKKAEIDIVVLDYIMPEMDASAVFDRLKQIKTDVRVLIASGYSEEGGVNELLRAGARGFVQKPFEIELLCRTIRATIDNE